MKGVKIADFIFEYEQKVFLILFAVFFIGMTCGSYSCFTLQTSLGEAFVASSGGDLFVDMLVKNLLALVISFLLGYTVIGFPFLCFYVLYSGICFGVFISLFTYSYGVMGCIIASVVMFPYYFTVIASELFVTFSSIRLSAALFNVFKDGTRYISPKVYSSPHIIKFFVFSALTAIATFFYSYVAIPLTYKIL